MTNIEPLEILNTILRPIESMGYIETAHKLLGNIFSIFNLAIVTNRMKYNPATGLSSVIQSIQQQNKPCIKIEHLPHLIEAVDSCNTYIEDKIAVKILLLTFLRTCELRKSKWSYIKWDKRQWIIPKEIIKKKKDHIVPLSNQSISLLKELYKITGHGVYLFPTKNFIKHPYMNENRLNNLLVSLGYKGEHSPHSFRSLASTALNELKPEWGDVIEIQQAHIEKNLVRRVYNRAIYLSQRIELMQFWADYIDLILNKNVTKSTS